MTTKTKPGRDIVVGDSLIFLGRAHRVTRIVPYVGNLVDDGTLPPDTRIAYEDVPGVEKPWGMTIPPNDQMQTL